MFKNLICIVDNIKLSHTFYLDLRVPPIAVCYTECDTGIWKMYTNVLFYWKCNELYWISNKVKNAFCSFNIFNWPLIYATVQMFFNSNNEKQKKINKNVSKWYLI